ARGKAAGTSPALRAGEAGKRAMVWVGPPLSARAASRGAAGGTVALGLRPPAGGLLRTGVLGLPGGGAGPPRCAWAAARAGGVAEVAGGVVGLAQDGVDEDGRGRGILADDVDAPAPLRRRVGTDRDVDQGHGPVAREDGPAQAVAGLGPGTAGGAAPCGVGG